MSQIIASDAPLLSAADNAPWEQHDSLRSPATSNGFGFNYYNLPPSPPHSIGSDSTDSPIPTSRMLKMRMSPDSCSDGEPQLCLPTHQVFDFPELSNPPSPSSGFSPPPSSPKPHRLSISINPGGKSGPGSKRAASPAPGVTKKQRSSGERISSKDFIPPDVSGLSKREARLVKNRAAAFLSRQRKREEFECMEVRVAELEQENARLLALSQNRSGSSRPKDESGDTLVSEIDKLRAQLAEAEKREQELSAELAEKASRDPPVKVEAVEPQVSITPARPASSIQSLHKSGASLGLMVLLCALPTLLSLPTHTAMPSTFVSRSTVARAASSSAFDFNPFMLNEQDWSRSNSMMDLDIDDHISSASTTTNTRKLEFVNGDSRLSSLDISFDTVSSENGKIRVRIHPSSSSGSSSPSSSFSTTLESSSLPMWSETDSDLLGSYGALSSKIGSTNDFLGVGSTSDFALDSDFMRDSSLSLFGQEMTSANFLPVGASDGFESDFCDVSGGGTRRVRIALKSMPSSGGEGGEWEVQLC